MGASLLEGNSHGNSSVESEQRKSGIRQRTWPLSHIIPVWFTGWGGEQTGELEHGARPPHAFRDLRTVQLTSICGNRRLLEVTLKGSKHLSFSVCSHSPGTFARARQRCSLSAIDRRFRCPIGMEAGIPIQNPSTNVRIEPERSSIRRVRQIPEWR
jgi:hypothetical protein